MYKEDILNLLALQTEEITSMTDCLLRLSNQVKAVKIEEKAKLPFHLNLLDVALEGKMKETAHSRFLWQLLRLNKILESFTNKFFTGFFSINEKYKLNIPDKFRIDISLQTETDFFIFENKINDAQEQCGQIYRYVSHAINKGYRANHIHVLYLNSVSYDAPSVFSLTKDGQGKETLPDSVDISVISYKTDIVNWLEEIYEDISNDEIYLKSAIFQYLDYLKEKFHISKRYSKMNNKIQSLIEDKLFSDDMNCLQKLKVISDAQEQLDQLKPHLKKIEEQQKSMRFQEWFDHLVSLYPIEKYKWVRNNPYDIHINFLYHGYDLAACLTIDAGRLCWGIRSITKVLPKNLNSSLHSSVQLFLPTAQSTDWWPAWNYTSYEKGLDRFLTLFKWIIENEDQEE